MAPLKRYAQKVQIRKYRDSDASSTLELFLRAIRETASADFTPEEIAAWAQDDRKLDVWAAKRAEASTIVATINGVLVGFTDLDSSGYIDMMFVHPDYGRRGVASTLLGHIVSLAQLRGITELRTHASITARPFFAKHGFVVVSEQYPVLDEVELSNFVMRRNLKFREKDGDLSAGSESMR
ncbi:MAG: GNAT family N-acetyltransferase [Microbacteriaceae bacterium]